MTNQQIMVAFFRGAELNCTTSTIAALQWYRGIAEATLLRYRQLGYVGPGVETQIERIEKIDQQLATWGA